MMTQPNMAMMTSNAVRRAVNGPRMMLLGLKAVRARQRRVRTAEDGAQDKRDRGEKCSHDFPEISRMRDQPRARLTTFGSSRGATERPAPRPIDLNQYCAMQRRYSASMQSERNDPALYLAKAAEYCTKAAATTDAPVRDALAAVALEFIAKALRRDTENSDKRNHKRNHDRNKKAPPKRG